MAPSPVECQECLRLNKSRNVVYSIVFYTSALSIIAGVNAAGGFFLYKLYEWNTDDMTQFAFTAVPIVAKSLQERRHFAVFSLSNNAQISSCKSKCFHRRRRRLLVVHASVSLVQLPTRRSIQSARAQRSRCKVLKSSQKERFIPARTHFNKLHNSPCQTIANESSKCSR